MRCDNRRRARAIIPKNLNNIASRFCNTEAAKYYRKYKMYPISSVDAPPFEYQPSARSWWDFLAESDGLLIKVPVIYGRLDRHCLSGQGGGVNYYDSRELDI